MARTLILPAIVSAVSDNECRRLAQLAQDKVVLECGAHFGRSTVVLGSVAERVHSVDWHKGDSQAGEGDSLRAYVDNIDRWDLRDRVVTHVGRFEDVLPLFKRASFDVVFLDGAHDDESILRDLDLLWPLLRMDGFLAMHDYGSGFPNVKPCIDGWIRQTPSSRFLDQVETLAVVVKVR